MTDRRRSDEFGFTLLEVLVALAILSISLSALLPMISNGLHLASKSEEEAANTALAQSLLARLGVDLPIRDGDTSGMATDGVGWTVHVVAYGDARDAESWPIQAKTVSVTVFREGSDRKATFTTLRLLPKDAGQ